jgi:hypothetical protein
MLWDVRIVENPKEFLEFFGRDLLQDDRVVVVGTFLDLAGGCGIQFFAEYRGLSLKEVAMNAKQRLFGLEFELSVSVQEARIHVNVLTNM